MEIVEIEEVEIEGGCLREGEYRGLDCVGGKICRELGPGCTLGTLAKEGLLRNARGTIVSVSW